MAAPYNNLMTKLEVAAAAVYAATTSPVAGFTGIDDATRTVPNVTFIGVQGEEFPQSSGNYKATLQVQVHSNVNDTAEATHRTLAATVFDVFSMDDLAATLSTNGSDFTVFGVNNPRMSERTEARVQVSEMEIDCYLCGSDIS